MTKSKLLSDTFLRDPSNLPTAYFALIMATGIVSIASYNLDFDLIAHLLLYFNIAAYLVMTLLYILRVVLYPKEFMADIKDHAKSPGFLTYVAGTCVLGSQFVIIVGNYFIASILFYIGIA